MPQSLARIWIQLVFSTKSRKPWLKDAKVRNELYRYMATILKGLDTPALIINGVEDHVHILFSLSRNYAVKKIVQDVKSNTSSGSRSGTRRVVTFSGRPGTARFR